MESFLVNIMKNLNKFILIIIVVISSMLCTNIFIVKEYQRLRNFEKTDGSIQIYIKDANVKTDDFLDELSSLSKKYNVSFIKPSSKQHNYYKSMIIDDDTFPYNKFGGYFNSENLPKKLGVFMKIGTLNFVDMKEYFDKTGDSINGEYSIISEKESEYDKLVVDLAEYLNQNPDTLMEKRYGSGFTYINNTSIFTSIGIVVALLTLLLVSIYTPLLQMRKIGIEKLLGIKKIDILKSLMLPNILTIILTSVLVDISVLLYNTYIPAYFLISLIFLQMLIILIYLIIGLALNYIIKKISISNMIKGFTSIKWLHFINFAFKIVFSIFTLGTLALLAISFNFTFDSLKQADFYSRKSPDYLTGEVIYSSEGAYTSGSEDRKNQYAAYKKMIERINDVKYIAYNSFEPYWYNNKYSRGYAIDILNVNESYLNDLGLKAHKGENVIYVPSSMKDKDLKEILSYYLADIKDTNDIDYEKLKKINIDIYYYDDTLETITYDEKKPFVKNPIVSLVDDLNMTEKVQSSLPRTGISNPIKIENTKYNRQTIEDIYKIYDGKFAMKFSPISSIFQERLDEYKSLIFKVSSVFVLLTVMSIFISFFIVEGYFLTENDYLNVTKLLGHKIFDRFAILFSIIGVIDAIFLILLILISKNWLASGIFILYILIDLLLIVFFIRFNDKKSLSSKLKGA